MKIPKVVIHLLVLATTGAGFAQQPAGDPISENLFPPELVMQNQQAIKLTEEQGDAIKSALQKTQTQFIDAQWKLEKEMETLRSLTKDERVDEKKVSSQLDKILDIERKIKKAHISLLVQVKNQLKPEQQSELKEIKARMMSTMGHGMSSQEHERLMRTIQSKAQEVQQRAQRLQTSGKDPSPIARIMDGIDPLLKQGKLDQVERELDRALEAVESLEREGAKKPEKSSNPNSKSDRSDLPETKLPAFMKKRRTPESLLAEIQKLIPEKLSWREISWKTCLLEALNTSREQQKPVLTWIFGGNPNHERC